ncbi:PQQ-like beta-propeller repeat protein [Crassaminicella thermophila]|uniref:PQQ-like beta-propeller repeat protein n=1 Tax=Crassaminicella thermophila TaxID=2599308 RepID=A0A5C0SHQ3_CRATE|nr:DUF5711 family protein [Crassaminicella thermophila]QEK13512.1 PQQ-like beta-propeller repeat protein [Crassaminicella thermophila]
MSRKRRPFRFKIFVLLALCILILGGAKLFNITRNFLGYGELGFQKIGTINYEKGKNLTIHPLKEEIVVYDGKILSLYNLQGDEKWSQEKEIKNAIIKSSENLFFLTDKKKGEITAYNDQGSVIWSVNLKKPISDLVCNNEGYIALYCENKENSEIYILNMNGKEEGKIIISKGTIIDITISEKEQLIALSIMNIENNKIKTNVVLYTKEGRLIGGNTYDEEIITNLFFSDDNRLMNVGDDKLLVFGKEKGVLWKKYISDTINRVAWNDQGFIGMHIINNKKTIIDTKNRNHIWLVGIDGTEISKIPIRGEVLGMDTKDNHVVAFTDRTLYLIFKKGQKVIEKKVNNDIKNVYMLPHDRLMLVFKNKIEIMQVKWKEQ